MSRVIFDKPFRPQDLLNGVEFEVDQQDNDSDEDFYDPIFEEMKENAAKPSQLDVDFDNLKPNMESITDDGLVKKQVLKAGSGIKIPDKSVVIMHYDAFLDKKKEPFDSTRRRNRPHKFLFGDGNVIPGLELGVQTMKKDEIARILISPEYGYGDMGCPPRIPGNAEILYVVEILNFFESKDAVEFDEMTPEEQRMAPFETIVKVFHCEHQVANELFRHKHYKQAIARYRKMARLLEDVSVENEEKDEQRKGYLMKLYLNLCLSYTNIRNSNKAIIYGDLAYKLNPNNPKALFRLGCAYLLADEFDKAKRFLTKARRYKPFESCVQKVLIELERKSKDHEQWEKMFCKKMFETKISEEETSASSDSKDFRNALEEQFKKFLESEDNELPFSAGYSDSQVDIIKELANKYNVAFVRKIHYDQKIIKVVKT